MTRRLTYNQQLAEWENTFSILSEFEDGLNDVIAGCDDEDEGKLSDIERVQKIERAKTFLMYVFRKEVKKMKP